MKVDIYTKACLTVIAVCLVLLCFRGSVGGPVYEQPTERLLRDRGNSVMKVQIVSIDESPNLRWEALPVAGQMAGGRYGPLEVRVE